MAGEQCFRMVPAAAGWSAPPARCTEPVGWLGVYLGGTGLPQVVYCCNDHVAEVDGAVAVDWCVSAAKAG